MIFAAFPIAEAEGVVLAHSLRLPSGALKKGRVLDADDVAALRAAGHDTVIGARLEAGDIAEDAAAGEAAALLAGPHLEVSPAKTGRCNLAAAQAGVLVVDRESIDGLNRLDESLTVATLAPWEVVAPGQMVATVKVIPFAVPASVLAAWRRLASDRPPLRLAPLRGRNVGLVLTHLPGMKEAVLDATTAVTRARLQALGSRLAFATRAPHAEKAVATAVRAALAGGCDLVLISGASATVDRRDVVPAGIVAAGGVIDHFGMPVDPGNLLLLARIGTVPIIDMPGCGRSPKLNGLDWVLARLLADEPVGSADIRDMGVGGLLKDIASRPLPRERAVRAETQPERPRVAALVLAAGHSRRMGANKLLAEVGGKPLVAHAVDAALASAADPVLVVTGHDADAVRAALAGRPVHFVDNPDHGEGMAASLRHGITALPGDVDGVLVCLGDMPAVTQDHLNRLIDAFAPAEGRAICVSAFEGKRGNPALIGRGFFAELRKLAGDVGARHVIAANDEVVYEVAQPDAGVLLDVDTPEALRKVAP